MKEGSSATHCLATLLKAVQLLAFFPHIFKGTRRALPAGANVKQEDKTGITAEDLKQREDSGELSEYSLSRKKRQRKCRKEEEGDWIPPKKAGRGPGMSTT